MGCTTNRFRCSVCCVERAILRPLAHDHKFPSLYALVTDLCEYLANVRYLLLRALSVLNNLRSYAFSNLDDVSPHRTLRIPPDH